MTVDVTVVIPVKDGTDPYISKCIDSLKNQDYAGIFEVLVIENGNRAQARNVGIMKAKGEIIAFIDADCVASTNWLSLITSHLKNNPNIGGVGGINYSPEDSPPLGKAIDFVFSSYLGSLGNASLSGPSKPQFVNGLACINSAYWTRILKQINGFNEDFVLCEDTNLSFKVRRAGYNLLFDKRILVWHYRRDTIKRFIKQFFSYGEGRMRSILTDKAYASKGVIIPFVGALLFPIILFFYPVFGLFLLFSYLMALLVKGIDGSFKSRNGRNIILIPYLFLLEHLSYLLGLIFGISKGRWTKVTGNSQILYSFIIERSTAKFL
jgi:GT2 family glycosyltransferase